MTIPQDPEQLSLLSLVLNPPPMVKSVPASTFVSGNQEPPESYYRPHAELFPNTRALSEETHRAYIMLDVMLKQGMGIDAFSAIMPLYGISFDTALSREQWNYLCAPIVVQGHQWAESIKSLSWLCRAVYRDRLAVIFEESINPSLKTAKVGSEVEAFAAFMTALAEAPLSSENFELFFWLSKRVCMQWRGWTEAQFLEKIDFMIPEYQLTPYARQNYVRLLREIRKHVLKETYGYANKHHSKRKVAA